MNPLDLNEILRRVFQAQAQDVLNRINFDEAMAGNLPPLDKWIKILADMSTSPLLRLWQAGIKHQLERQWQRQRRRGPSPSRLFRMSGFLFNPKVLQAVDDLTLKFCKETNETAKEDLETATKKVRQVFKEGLPRGDCIQLLTRQVQTIFSDPFRAFRIATTETSRAMHGGQLYSMKQQADLIKEKEWLASSDACERCIAMNGQRRKLDEPFERNGTGPYAVCQTPPLHPHCLLPETSVFAPGTVVAIKAFFSGTCIRVKLTNGDSFACTPNHMFLTRYGFLPAQSLVEGDDIICCSDFNRTFGSNPDNNDNPTTIEQVFCSASKSSGMSSARVPVAPEYLHSDAAICKGNIDVITTDSFLRYVLQVTDTIQESTQKTLFESRDFSNPLDSKCPSNLARFLLRLAPFCGMSRSRHLGALLLAKNLKRVPLLSGGHSESTQRSQDCSSLTPIPIGQSMSGSSSQISLPDFLSRNGVESKRCAHVEPFSYTGPVYDLTTQASLYCINSGIVSSNCFCDMTEVF